MEKFIINLKYHKILRKSIIEASKGTYPRETSCIQTKMHTHGLPKRNHRDSPISHRALREVGAKRGKSGDLNQSHDRLGSFPKQDGRKTRDLSPRAVFDGGSGEPTILHLLSHVIDPLFSTLEAIILTGVNIYRETKGEKRQVREGREGPGRGWAEEERATPIHHSVGRSARQTRQNSNYPRGIKWNKIALSGMPWRDQSYTL